MLNRSQGHALAAQVANSLVDWMRKSAKSRPREMILAPCSGGRIWSAVFYTGFPRNRLPR